MDAFWVGLACAVAGILLGGYLGMRAVIGFILRDWPRSPKE